MILKKVIKNVYFFKHIVYYSSCRKDNFPTIPRLGDLMNIQQAIELISNTSFSVKELDDQINSSHLLKDLQEEAERISQKKSETRFIWEIEKACRIGKRAETILLNLKDPQTGENLFKDNPEQYQDLIFIPTGEKVEVKSRRSLSAAINYIDDGLGIAKKTHNKAKWCVFFIGNGITINFYKLIDLEILEKELDEKLKNKTKPEFFIVKKKGNSYTIKTDTLSELLKSNTNILFEDIGIIKSAQWFNVHKRVSQYKGLGYYVFENMLN